MSATLEAMVSQASVALGSPPVRIGRGKEKQPRFELFNGPNSLCSQKVRAVLSQHEIDYISHSVNMFAGQTYLPDYVRLRMVGCERLGIPLMTTHHGSTSVTSGGCDAAVVPTLVDWEADAIVVDSKRISFYIDNTVAEQNRLRPRRILPQIDSAIDVVDNLPNYQMVIGTPPGEDGRPTSIRGHKSSHIAMQKVDRLDKYLAVYGDDPVLSKAYGAKRSKELMAATTLFSDAAMRSAYSQADAACENLNALLKARKTRWLLDDHLTMADLFWWVELLRMKNLGATRFWESNARAALAEYLREGENVPAIRSAILEWPGALY